MISNQQKVESAKEYKNKGNEFFKANELKKATVNYSKALAYTKCLPGRSSGLEGLATMAMNSIPDSDKISTELSKEVDGLDSIIKTNLATCFIKLEDFTKALENANEALTLNPHSWKASLRMAEAFISLNNYEKGMAVLKETTELIKKYGENNSAGLAAVAKLRAKAKQTKKGNLEKQKKAFSGIFEKASLQEEK